MPTFNARTVLTLCAALLVGEAWPRSASADPPLQLLPLQRVRLYEVGVGYFERSGTLQDKADLGLSLPQSQLDDALTSLVILGGANKARIADIEFESRESPELARAEAALPADPDTTLDFASVLGSFRGVLVEVRGSGVRLRGRLVDVIPLAQASAEQCVERRGPSSAATGSAASAQPTCDEARDASLVVLNTDGTLSRLALSRVASVRALDPTVAARLTRALDAVSRRGAAPSRRILHVHGSGSAKLGLGYVAEAPVWRASYRLLLDDSGKAGQLQGFALIHNDTDETWRQVSLELVNGRPSSFLYPLAAPRYARRELQTPTVPLSTVPQLLNQNADDRWKFDDSEGTMVGGSISAAYGEGGLGLSGTGEGGGGRGEGIGLGSVGSIGHGAPDADTTLTGGNLTDLNVATGVEGAAQFLYRVGAPIDLGAHASALVPFVSESLTLSRVTWFGSDDENAQTALRVRNSSAQTLPEGVISIFSEAGFTGSAQLPRTKPGETRLLTFGADLDVSMQRETHDVREEPQSYASTDGDLVVHALRTSQISVQLSNKSVAERTVSMALPISRNARVEGADDAAYDSARSEAVISFQLPAHRDATRELKVVEGVQSRTNPKNVSSETLKQAAGVDSVDPAQRAILSRAADELFLAEIRLGALPKRKTELEDALADVTRLESHVRALGQSTDEGHLAAQRLRQTEDQVQQLRLRIATLESEIAAYQNQARRTLSTLGRPKAVHVEHSLADTPR